MWAGLGTLNHWSWGDKEKHVCGFMVGDTGFWSGIAGIASVVFSIL